MKAKSESRDIYWLFEIIHETETHLSLSLSVTPASNAFMAVTVQLSHSTLASALYA